MAGLTSITDYGQKKSRTKTKEKQMAKDDRFESFL